VGKADPIQRAVQQLRRLPGIGQKTATRLVYWMLRAPEGTVSELAKALHDLEGSIRECDICATFCVSERCALCSAPGRDHTLICVVEHPQDILAFERSGEFRGLYHVLHGAISPLDGITPDTLRVRELLHRLRDRRITEVILATNPTVEGDSTALYLSRLLDPIEVKVSRLAHGISVGTEIEYADAISLARALQNRTLFGAL
jgi:recombination protein RecR